MLEADVEVDRREFSVSAALSVAAGERLALFGPSGAGKTTLLETIAGLVRPGRARITLGGRVLTSTTPPERFVPPWRRRVGLLRQDPALFPHPSVRGNLCYVPGTDRSGPELAQVAETLGISGLLPAMPAQLSGGQAHRVALGLAILDRGRLLQVGAPDEVVLRPASRRVAELVGYLGFVPVTGHGGAVAGVHPERVTAGAHPHRGVVLTGTVAACRPAGAGWEADLAIGDATVVCRLPERIAPAGGELAVTALDPPWFGPYGAAIDQPGHTPAPGRPTDSEHIRS